MLSFRKFPVAEISMDWRGSYQDVPSKNFCLTMPKTLAREPFLLCFTKLPLAKKIMDKSACMKIFRRKVFV